MQTPQILSIYWLKVSEQCTHGYHLLKGIVGLHKKSQRNLLETKMFCVRRQPLGKAVSYVCVHACMHVHTYVCMFVCFVCTHVCFAVLGFELSALRLLGRCATTTPTALI
jgi:hypothetical protein